MDVEADVHSATSYMLAGQKYQARGFSFLHAYSGEEARAILAAEQDVVTVLLDVVMETADSGLKLVR